MRSEWLDQSEGKKMDRNKVRSVARGQILKRVGKWIAVTVRNVGLIWVFQHKVVMEVK